MNTSPIGMFDSGIGGLSILNEINKMLPNENIVYLADNKNCPYGNKSKEEIIKLSIKNTSCLIKMGCKIIVIACNTATTNAVNEIRASFSIPIIGIEPAIKPALLSTKTGVIGVLATEKTLSSNVFYQTSNQHIKNFEIHEQIGFGLVDIIENGDLNKKATKQLLLSYLTPMIDFNIDQLVLGCTHYHFLIPLIKKILPKKINIQNPNQAIVKQIKKMLCENKLENTLDNSCKNIVYANGSTQTIKKTININSEIKLLDF
tara:strand:- start:5024 stop:5803 length:780 start_codon:yes stop_codon:yes gene_type:complete